MLARRTSATPSTASSASDSTIDVAAEKNRAASTRPSAVMLHSIGYVDNLVNEQPFEADLSSESPTYQAQNHGPSPFPHGMDLQDKPPPSFVRLFKSGIGSLLNGRSSLQSNSSRQSARTITRATGTLAGSSNAGFTTSASHAGPSQMPNLPGTSFTEQSSPNISAMSFPSDVRLSGAGRNSNVQNSATPIFSDTSSAHHGMHQPYVPAAEQRVRAIDPRASLYSNLSANSHGTHATQESEVSTGSGASGASNGDDWWDQFLNGKTDGLFPRDSSADGNAARGRYLRQ
jgi:hypothetical protein